jgi:hypothetical protein
MEKGALSAEGQGAQNSLEMATSTRKNRGFVEFSALVTIEHLIS